MRNGLRFWTVVLLTIVCLFSSAMADLPVTIDIMEDGTFYFGRFEQDNNIVNGKEPILWRVLDVDWEHDYILAMSVYGLYTMNYHHSDSTTYWADTDVRAWLNHAFASSAFTVDERKHVAITDISDSMDRFFLLDAVQVKKYLEEPYLCEASKYAIATGAYVNERTKTSSWLVRTDVASRYIAWVGGAGALYLPDNGKMKNNLTTNDNVVRPAMWISLDEINNGEIIDFAKTKPVVTPAPKPDGLYAFTLDSTIATRSGPSTQYAGLGSYHNVSQVKVISRASDGNIMWLEVEFQDNGLKVRCYTGLKRVNVNINAVPDDPAGFIANATVTQDTGAYFGPGRLYKKEKDLLTPKIGTMGKVVKTENGWYCFEFETMVENQMTPVRVWLPADALALE